MHAPTYCQPGYFEQIADHHCTSCFHGIQGLRHCCCRSSLVCKQRHQDWMSPGATRDIDAIGTHRLHTQYGGPLPGEKECIALIYRYMVMRSSVRLRLSVCATRCKGSQRCDDPQLGQRMRCRPELHKKSHPLDSK